MATRSAPRSCARLFGDALVTNEARFCRYYQLYFQLAARVGIDANFPFPVRPFARSFPSAVSRFFAALLPPALLLSPAALLFPASHLSPATPQAPAVLLAPVAILAPAVLLAPASLLAPAPLLTPAALFAPSALASSNSRPSYVTCRTPRLGAPIDPVVSSVFAYVFRAFHAVFGSTK